MSLASGDRLGPYGIVEPVGAGGMGEVYLARDARLERNVALKVLPEAMASDPAYRRRFEIEARAASALSHPNAAHIYDVGEEGGPESHPEPISAVGAAQPAELDRIISKCLAKERELRYATAQNLFVDLRSLHRALESGVGAMATTAPRRGVGWWIAAAAVAALAGISWGVWGGLPAGEASIDSIAVLPFENVTGDADVGYLSEGISESLINSLSRLPDVKVISRSSVSAAMKQFEDPKEIGAKLGVRALVLGRVAQRGDHIEWDLRGAEKAFQRALVLAPSNATVYIEHAFLLWVVGRNDEAIASSRRALELDPLGRMPMHNLGISHLFARDYEASAAAFRRALEVHPSWVWGHVKLGVSYAFAGRPEEALAAAEKATAAVDRLREMARTGPVDPVDIASVYSQMGDADATLQWLERALDEHSPWVPFIPNHVFFDGIRDDPRFQAIVERFEEASREASS